MLKVKRTVLGENVLENRDALISDVVGILEKHGVPYTINEERIEWTVKPGQVEFCVLPTQKRVTLGEVTIRSNDAFFVCGETGRKIYMPRVGKRLISKGVWYVNSQRCTDESEGASVMYEVMAA